ncbi:hypothetical protein N658DRAFT_324595 [Parathielavia hyrcaniae]|uniref:Uncharacterized protein n=1 Tax=Parathielavia hyrcaniae TaxID=113614 RepID=A0AAN6T3M1_9PEZI|nr:hypothetical protein N658DRAFT_324595 [Parathielavia hyrcaniae]
MGVAPVSSPAPTPQPSLAGALGLGLPLQARQTDYYNYSYDTDCYNYQADAQCVDIVSGCYDGFVANTGYSEALTALTSCYCEVGISFLDCFYSEIATGTCAQYWFGTSYDYGQFQQSWYTEYCGTIPPSVMPHLQPPSSVNLEFASIDVVTATAALDQPDYDGQPLYQGSGQLLRAECSATDFTLVDAGSTVYYAGFMGCVKDRPECCPWAVATATATAQDNDRVYDFPTPVDDGLARLPSCADDYYSISGGCCPTGFWPFTKEIGGITPCWSSVRTVDPPTLTVEEDAQTKDKPTSAVINIVWAMRYPVDDSSGGKGLSTAAKAGIGAGAGVAAILIGGLAICLWRSRRKNKKLAEAQSAAPPAMAPNPTGQYPAPGTYPPGMLPPGKVPSPSDRTSVMTNTTLASAPTLAPQQHPDMSAGGGVSQNGQHVLHNSQPGGGSYFPHGAVAANPRVSYGSSTGAVSPPLGGASGQQGYPAPIAEADEGQPRAQAQGQYLPYGYQQQQQQQQQQQYYGVPAQGQGQGQYYHHPQAQGGYVYPHPQQHGYPPQNAHEMSSGREADPPQEVMGSEVQPQQQQHHQTRG